MALMEKGGMKIERVWAMPSRNTFSIKPIGDFVRRHMAWSAVSIDPFARDEWATYTNDLNPSTKAQAHTTAIDFLGDLKARKIEADLIIFDPPYSVQQIKEVYASVGLPVANTLAYNSTIGHWANEKDLCASLLKDGGIFLHFGWHSNGLGKKRNAVIEEILLVAHGRAHYDTICMAERLHK